MSRARGSKVLAALSLLGGCEDEVTNVDIELLLPENEAPLSVADNATVRLEPNGFTDSFAVDGPRFEFSVELEPDGDARRLTVFIAAGTTLLGYGSTPSFRYSTAAGATIRLLIAFPGALATFPTAVGFPDPSVLAASTDPGIIIMAGDGTTVVLDALSLDLVRATRWPDEVERPNPDDGALVPEPGGRATRVWWSASVRGEQYDALANTWQTRHFVGDIAGRPGASFVHLRADERLLVFGGGRRADALSIDLSEDPAVITVDPSFTMDGPRQAAHAIITPQGEPVIAGGSDPSLPRIRLPARDLAVGPMESWTGLRCIATDERVWCGGGQRRDAPTPDALAFDLSEPTAVQELPDFLTTPMSDVRWFVDDLALYAQGAERFIRIDKSNGEVSEPGLEPRRATQGTIASLHSGAQLLIGGLDAEGNPVDRWQIFAPALPGA